MRVACGIGTTHAATATEETSVVVNSTLGLEPACVCVCVRVCACACACVCRRRSNSCNTESIDCCVVKTTRVCCCFLPFWLMGAVGDGVAWVVVWVRSAWGWVALLAAVVRVCVCVARRQFPLFRVANTGTHGTYVDYARACCAVVEVVVCMCVHAAIFAPSICGCVACRIVVAWFWGRNWQGSTSGALGCPLWHIAARGHQPLRCTTVS